LGIVDSRAIQHSRPDVRRLFPRSFAPLLVEVDGASHRSPTQRRAAARRDRRLQHAGYRVLRLPAELVLNQLSQAIQLVRDAL
jgi:very-short-patch-repair endonuclease